MVAVTEVWDVIGLFVKKKNVWRVVGRDGVIPGSLSAAKHCLNVFVFMNILQPSSPAPIEPLYVLK